MGRMSRDKGKRGERELANALRNCGYETRRGQQYSGTETSADVVGLPGIHIECKRTESLRLYESLEQAERDAGASGDLPAVFHRKNGKPWAVIMELGNWLKLYGGDRENVSISQQDKAADKEQ